MATNFPTSLDNFTNPSSGNTLDSPSHSLQHSDANDAIEAIEAKLGVGASPAGSATAGQVLTAQGGGTALWTTPTSSGLVLITNSNFSGASTHSFGSDASPIFTSAYRNYKIILDDMGSATSDQNINFRLRANTTDLTAANYEWQQLTATSTTVAGSRNSAQTSIRLGTVGSGTVQSSIVLDITVPQLAKYKNVQSHNAYNENLVGPRVGLFYGMINSAVAYNGFTIFASTNISGTVSIYGYNI